MLFYVQKLHFLSAFPIHSSLHVTLALYKLFLLTYLLTYLSTVINEHDDDDVILQ